MHRAPAAVFTVRPVFTGAPLGPGAPVVADAVTRVQRVSAARLGTERRGPEGRAPAALQRELVFRNLTARVCFPVAAAFPALQVGHPLAAGVQARPCIPHPHRALLATEAGGRMPRPRQGLELRDVALAASDDALGIAAAAAAAEGQGWKGREGEVEREPGRQAEG